MAKDKRLTTSITTTAAVSNVSSLAHALVSSLSSQSAATPAATATVAHMLAAVNGDTTHPRMHTPTHPSIPMSSVAPTSSLTSHVIPVVPGTLGMPKPSWLPATTPVLEAATQTAPPSSPVRIVASESSPGTVVEVVIGASGSDAELPFTIREVHGAFVVVEPDADASTDAHDGVAAAGAAGAADGAPHAGTATSLPGPGSVLVAINNMFVSQLSAASVGVLLGQGHRPIRLRIAVREAAEATLANAKKADEARK